MLMMPFRRSKRITVWHGDETDESRGQTGIEPSDIVINVHGPDISLPKQPGTNKSFSPWNQRSDETMPSLSDHGRNSGVISVTVQRSAQATVTPPYEEQTCSPKLALDFEFEDENSLLDVEDAPLYLTDPLACSLKAASSPRLILESSHDVEKCDGGMQGAKMAEDEERVSQCDSSQSMKTTPDSSPRVELVFKSSHDPFEIAMEEPQSNADVLVCSHKAVSSPRLEFLNVDSHERCQEHEVSPSVDVELKAMWQPQTDNPVHISLQPRA
jgi:hypothetical protein